MIKIKINYDGKFVKDFKIFGHANYEDEGKDIVCAAVSSIVITSVNLALRFDDKSLEVKEDKGLIDAKVLTYNDTINEVLINMIEMLTELQTQYKKYVKII